MIKSIDFGSVSNCLSISNTSQFDFYTSYRIVKDCTSLGSNAGEFCFSDVIPTPIAYSGLGWHTGEKDHTSNDKTGCMYLVYLNGQGTQIFKQTVNDLEVGQQYQFSAYLANFVNVLYRDYQIGVRFEVRNISSQHELLAQCNTDNIQATSSFKWHAYGVIFQAFSSSVELLIISNTAKAKRGNKLAIDDIRLVTLLVNRSIAYSTGKFSFIFFNCNMNN